jgi:hypothetical protein
MHEHINDFYFDSAQRNKNRVTISISLTLVSLNSYMSTQKSAHVMQRDFLELQTHDVMSDEILAFTRGLQATGIVPYRRVPESENYFSNTKDGHYSLIRNVRTKVCSWMFHLKRSKSVSGMDDLIDDIVRSKTF